MGGLEDLTRCEVFGGVGGRAISGNDRLGLGLLGRGGGISSSSSVSRTFSIPALNFLMSIGVDS